MKKLISFLLILVLLFSLPCASAFAEDPLTWSLIAGTLVISGRGELHDFSTDAAPWRSYDDEVTNIYVMDGVTRIGDQAFQYMSHARNAFVPDSVTEIGEEAFYRCTSLASVTLPSELEELGSSAFDHCSALSSIVIPDGIDTIEDATFNCCRALVYIYIPESVTEIEESAFNACTSLDTVYYGGSEKQWKNIEIEGYNKALKGAKLVCGTKPSAFPDATAPSGSQAPASASGSIRWNYSKDKTLTISGRGAMPDYGTDTPPWVKQRDEIRRIVIEPGVTHIGAQTFQYCKSVKSVSIPDSVTSIGDAAFYKCNALSEITLPSGLTFLGKQAFDHCTKLREIVIPSGITEISESAFNCCEELRSVSLPRTVSSIANSAFNGCKKLEDVWFDGSAAEWSAIDVASYNRPLTSAYVHTSDSLVGAAVGGVIG